jgi:hypothetical protein
MCLYVCVCVCVCEQLTGPSMTNRELDELVKREYGFSALHDYYGLYECGQWDVFECTVIPEERVVDMMER